MFELCAARTNDAASNVRTREIPQFSDERDNWYAAADRRSIHFGAIGRAISLVRSEKSAEEQDRERKKEGGERERARKEHRRTSVRGCVEKGKEKRRAQGGFHERVKEKERDRENEINDEGGERRVNQQAN